MNCRDAVSTGRALDSGPRGPSTPWTIRARARGGDLLTWEKIRQRIRDATGYDIQRLREWARDLGVTDDRIDAASKMTSAFVDDFRVAPGETVGEAFNSCLRSRRAAGRSFERVAIEFGPGGSAEIPPSFCPSRCLGVNPARPPAETGAGRSVIERILSV